MEDDRFVKCPLVDEMIEDIDCIEKQISFLIDLRKKTIGKQFVRNANGIIIDTIC